MNSNRDVLKVRYNDGIVGVLYMSSALLAMTIQLDFIWIALAVAALKIASPFTKFCPVYFVLNKLMPDTEPIQNGK